MEKLKNSLIIFLFCTMLVGSFVSMALWNGGRGDNFIRELFYPVMESYGDPGDGQGVKQVLVPYKISVINGSNIYTENSITENSGIYRDLESLLYEAMGSMEHGTVQTATEYLHMYQDSVIVVRNSGKIPLELYRAQWEKPLEEEGIIASQLTLSKKGKGVVLGLRDLGTGRHYRYDTAADSTAFDKIIGQYSGKNAIYANEISGLTDESGIAVVGTLPTTGMAYEIVENGYSITGENERAFLTALGINPYLAKNYAKSLGEKVYVEDGNVLHTDIKGKVSYKAKDNGIRLEVEPGDRERALSLAVAKLMEAVAIVNRAPENITISLENIVEKDQELIARFFVKIDGNVVSDPGYSCGFVISQGYMRELWLDLPQIVATTTVQVLSEKDGAVLAEPNHSMEFETVYKVQNGTLVPCLSSLEGE